MPSWRQEGFGASVRVALMLGCTAFLCGCRGTSDPRSANVTTAGGASTVSAVPAGSRIQSAPEDALSLWKRTLLAARTSTGVATVIETRFSGTGGEHDAVQFDVIESEGRQRGPVARYRLTYAAPDAMKGVVILNDGHHVWRYNAHKRLIARQASITAPIPPELEDGVAAIPIQADGAHPEIEAGPERVAGRLTEVLALRTRRAGRIVERRWIDRETGRTMRLEQYAGRDAHIVRRVEIVGFRPLKSRGDLAWAASQFAPAFPNGARMVESGTSHMRHLAEAEEVARRVQLPLHVRGFALQSVERMPTSTAAIQTSMMAPSGAVAGREAPATRGDSAVVGSVADTGTASTRDCSAGSPNCDPSLAAPATVAGSTHLYYSKSNQAISIFVSEVASARNETLRYANEGSSANALQSRDGWTAVPLTGGRTGFVSVQSHGSAIAWRGASGASYIAVAHLSLAEFLPIIRAFVADRDDAPSASGSGR